VHVRATATFAASAVHARLQRLHIAFGQMTAEPGFQHDAGELDRPSPNHMDAGSWGTVAYAGSNANGPREVQEDRWVAVPRLLEVSTHAVPQQR
jgi:hypothetical protein